MAILSGCHRAQAWNFFLIARASSVSRMPRTFLAQVESSLFSSPLPAVDCLRLALPEALYLRLRFRFCLLSGVPLAARVSLLELLILFQQGALVAQLCPVALYTGQHWSYWHDSSQRRLLFLWCGAQTSVRAAAVVPRGGCVCARAVPSLLAPPVALLELPDIYARTKVPGIGLHSTTSCICSFSPAKPLRQPLDRGEDMLLTFSTVASRSGQCCTRRLQTTLIRCVRDKKSE